MINIILYQPEISPNTANIIRTTFAAKAKLHIIKPTAFDLHPHWLKRKAAGHFLSEIQHEIHENYDSFYAKYGSKNIYYITRYGLENYSNIDYKNILGNDNEIWIMFGTESTGIPKKIMQNNIKNCLRIPMNSECRSLNLANSVAIVLYEILRQNSFEGLSAFESQKGKDFILKKD
ncbi:tRNA (cytidine(34)-2'-O)-methyltransferase [Mycoplasma enhydrae]|uniref:tRNA (cytidine(34)-2'-O)-methyltransferase n=1 Tax=Mycoplasma enhydrae TaxID=2499220 RepID=UPI00197B9D54|nr:tRNA (cytidine(34)-2'-O)-methyltransferase [Mycoplasma enhydrae]MBN4089466.1 tRNA (cytidine(34)-2'-O)-methyltransferase [Mycoplasma enhydrae]MCV3733689.1 tRNA (cytidine(34)-2'-O)-methyltransferase [Mycoplasma enhydrae]MCV3753329.1 tRNA (cytidine(34)-2'-O)-methyltransferase [Mycoplasma enhydrae]